MAREKRTVDDFFQNREVLREKFNPEEQFSLADFIGPKKENREPVGITIVLVDKKNGKQDIYHR